MALGTVCGLLLWHTVSWHSGGAYGRMYDDMVQGSSLLPVFYNVGLIIGLGLALGLLMQRITRALGYRVTRIKHFEDEEKERQ